MSKLEAPSTAPRRIDAERPVAAAKPAPGHKAPNKGKPAATGKAAKPAQKSSAKPAPKSSSKAPSKSAAKTVVKAPAKKPSKAAPTKAKAAPGKASAAKPDPKKAAAKKAPAPKTAPVKKSPPKAAATKSPPAPAKKAKTPPVEKVLSPKTGEKVNAKTTAPSSKAAAPAKPSATPATRDVPTAKAAAPETAATKPQARASAKSPVHMPLPAVPTQAQQASRFADRFAPPKPAARVVVEAPDQQLKARKDPKLANAWKTKTGRELTEAELMAMPDDAYMNEQQLEFFRKRLNDLKDDLLSNAGETTEHLREDTSVVPDPADRATIEEEHALELRTRDRERKLLKKIAQSLARIEAGDYGYCDETGEPIGLARLLARPTATLSLEAQQRRELKQKMFGD